MEYLELLQNFHTKKLFLYEGVTKSQNPPPQMLNAWAPGLGTPQKF